MGVKGRQVADNRLTARRLALGLAAVAVLAGCAQSAEAAFSADAETAGVAQGGDSALLAEGWVACGFLTEPRDPWASGALDAYREAVDTGRLAVWRAAARHLCPDAGPELRMLGVLAGT